jgi:hydrogenase maturation protease
MTASAFNTVLIGVGNPFRSDDAVGLAVVHHLLGRVPPGVTLQEESGDGTELLEAWKDAACAILVDAVQSGAPPGTIHRFDAHAEKLPTWFSHSSTHSFGIAEAIELARTMGELPSSLIVYGIEGLDFSPGTQLSPELAEIVPAAADLVLQELQQLSERPKPANQHQAKSAP